MNDAAPLAADVGADLGPVPVGDAAVDFGAAPDTGQPDARVPEGDASVPVDLGVECEEG